MRWRCRFNRLIWDERSTIGTDGTFKWPPAPQPSLRPVVRAYPSCYLLARVTSRGRPRRSRRCLAQLTSQLPPPRFRLPMNRRDPKVLFNPSIPTTHHPLSPALSFHTLMNCPSPPIDLHLLYFQALLNCFFRKSFVFTIICVALCFFGPNFASLTTRHSPLATFLG